MPKKLQEITLGVQRVTVVLPVEEQEDVGAVVVARRPDTDRNEVEVSS